jgi:hypothetical protein
MKPTWAAKIFGIRARFFVRIAILYRERRLTMRATTQTRSASEGNRRNTATDRSRPARILHHTPGHSKRRRRNPLRPTAGIFSPLLQDCPPFADLIAACRVVPPPRSPDEPSISSRGPIPSPRQFITTKPRSPVMNSRCLHVPFPMGYMRTKGLAHTHSTFFSLTVILSP